jgi:hypothetical protein
VFVRRSLAAAVGLPDATLHYVMDWEYWLRLGLHLRPGIWGCVVRYPTESIVLREYYQSSLVLGMYGLA